MAVRLDAETISNFVNLYLAPNFADKTASPPCHMEWWEMCTSKHKYVAIAAPRGFSKSTAITLSYTLASILFRTKKFVIILSDTEAQSSFFLNNIKRELAVNDDLRKDFGVKGFSKETETDIVIEFEDGYQARIIAKGSEQKLRGLNWNNYRPDLLIGDDMENDEIVLNSERREKFKRWWAGAVLPILSKDGEVRIVGTILHMDSLLEGYMPKPYDKGATRTALKIVSSFQRSYWWSAKYRAHTGIGDYSDLLWPEYKSKEWLQREYEARKQEGLTDIYAQEMLNEPIDESRSLFRKSDFGELSEDQKLPPLNYYIGMDLATTKDNAQRDYSSFVIGGLDSTNVLNVVLVIKERFDILENVEIILRLNKTFKPVAFISEKGQLANSILPVLKVRMFEDNNFVNFVTYPAQTDKTVRSSSIRARMRAGAVKFKKYEEWFLPFQTECIQFPRSVHDDQVDALSWLGVGLDKLVEAPSEEEEMKNEYEEDLAEARLEAGGDGRSHLTGY